MLPSVAPGVHQALQRRCRADAHGSGIRGSSSAMPQRMVSARARHAGQVHRESSWDEEGAAQRLVATKSA